MQGKIMRPDEKSKVRWVVKHEGDKEVIGCIVGETWFGLSDIYDNPKLHQYYHEQLKKGKIA